MNKQDKKEIMNLIKFKKMLGGRKMTKEEDLMIKAGKIACEMSLEIDKLKRIIEIKDEYFKLINFLLIDYDGCNTAESLKELIDETRDYIHKALKNDDKSVITVNSKKKFNILGEEVE